MPVHLYIMGESHIQPDKIEFKNFLKMARYYQFYLTQALLLDAGEWSLKAEYHLGEIYQKIWKNLKNKKKPEVFATDMHYLLNHLKYAARVEKNKKLQTIWQAFHKKNRAFDKSEFKKPHTTRKNQLKKGLFSKKQK